MAQPAISSGRIPPSPSISENTEENLAEITTDDSLKNAENERIDRDALAAQLAFHGVGVHQIAPAIAAHSAELQRRLEFLPYVQIRKTTAAYLMANLKQPYSEPPEFAAARDQTWADNQEAIRSLVGGAASAKAMP